MPRKFIYGLLVGLGAALVAMGLWLTGGLDRWEYTTWSWRARLFAAPGPATAQIKLILLDQASLDWGARENGWAWPWPRQVYAPIVDFCVRGGAKVIAFDVIYSEPSAYDVADDEALGAAIAASGRFIAAAFLGRQTEQATNWPSFVPSAPLRVEGLDEWLRSPAAARLVMPGAAFPIPQVVTNARMVGNVKEVPDADGVFRRTALFRVFDGQAVPILGAAAFWAGAESGPWRIGDGWLVGDRLRAPIDGAGRTILRYRGRSGTHQAFGAAAVIQSELRLQAGEPPTIDPAVFKDKYVLFGFSAPGLKDFRPTPIARDYPGVEIHATILDNCLAGDFIRETPAGLAGLLILMLALISGVAVTESRRVWQNTAAFVVLLPLPLLLGFALYPAGYWLPVMAGETAVALALVGATIVNYATEGRQKAFIKSAFKQYLGAEVIEQLIADPGRLQLGGERRTLTLFFSDIEKFSSFSERLDPPTLTTLLNDFLSDMTDIILEEGGYLDKYIGDAIVAFWNAPLDQADHAVRAVRSAIRCQRRLAERRDEFFQRTGALVKMRVGINTGEVVVGNMGSRNRFNYTVLGDAANLASRLEGANKAFGTYVMVSEATWLLCKNRFPGRELGRLTVVGRKTPVRVYEPLGLEGEPLPSAMADYARALELCRAGKTADALRIFEGLPDDPPARKYADQCRMLLKSSDPVWDGIWNLTEKG